MRSFLSVLLFLTSSLCAQSEVAKIQQRIDALDESRFFFVEYDKFDERTVVRFDGGAFFHRQGTVPVVGAYSFAEDQRTKRRISERIVLVFAFQSDKMRFNGYRTTAIIVVNDKRFIEIPVVYKVNTVEGKNGIQFEEVLGIGLTKTEATVLGNAKTLDIRFDTIDGEVVKPTIAKIKNLVAL